MKKFRHLNVPSHWEHYWSKYPEGYTIMEALLNWVNQVDDMVDNVNNWNEYLEDFVETFDEKLRPHVREFLQEMDNSGRLAEIINDELLGEINQKVDNYQDEVNQKVDNYQGEVNQKVDNYQDEVIQQVGNYQDEVNQQVDTYQDEVIDTINSLVRFLELDTSQSVSEQINSFYSTLNEGETFQLGSGSYELDGELIFDRNIHLDFSNVEFESVMKTGTAIRVGDRGGRVQGIVAHLPKLKKDIVDWVTDTTGIEILNIYNSTISNIWAENYKKGVVFNSLDGVGNSYNQYYFGRVVNNQVSATLTSTNGWTNENSFYGGRFGWTSERSPYMTSANRHVLFEYNDYSQNNNRFYGVSFESAPQTGQEYAVYIEDGRMNYFRECRYEGAWNIHLEKGLDIQFTDGFGLEVVGFTGVTPSVIRSINRNSNMSRNSHVYRNSNSSDSAALTVENVGGSPAIDLYGNGNIHSTGSGHFRRGVRWYSGTEGEVRGLFEGAGSPEGKVVAAPGSIYLNVSGGDETLFVKEREKDSTGWVLYTKPDARESTAYRPRFLGDIAVRNGIAHVAVGLTTEDWVQITNV